MKLFKKTLALAVGMLFFNNAFAATHHFYNWTNEYLEIKINNKAAADTNFDLGPAKASGEPSRVTKSPFACARGYEVRSNRFPTLNLNAKGPGCLSYEVHIRYNPTKTGIVGEVR